MTMQPALDECLARLALEDGVLVRVTATQGSAPREAGTWMAVWRAALTGTIGGGQLEYQAIAAARGLLARCGDGSAGASANASAGAGAGAGAGAAVGAGAGAGAIDTPADGATLRYPLGPSLGQCCGGVMFLSYRRITAADAPSLRAELTEQLAPVALFGGGHVGAAIVRLLSALPYAVRWIDSRDGVFPPEVPAQVQTEHSEPVHGAVAALPAGSRVLIMSFSHAEDLDIVIACLQRLRARGDLPFVGLIGSKTKWATFRHRLQARGFGDDELARITCPIGVPGIAGKEPEVIAVAVAAQLLQVAPPVAAA